MDYGLVVRIVLLLVALCPLGAPTEDFTFVHCSDTHSPVAGSEETIAEMRGLGEIELEPYKVRAKAPAFVVVTGDLTEFGGPAAGRAWWEKYLGYWKEFKIPIYHCSGNHDATWDCLRPALRKIHGGACYSFEKFGCRFIVLDSSTPQDPRPSFGEEVVAWLREDLRGVKKGTPLFLFMHHPPEPGREFASGYDLQRLFDAVRGHTVAGFFVGHYHRAFHKVVEGYDLFGGGSTFGGDRGCSIVSVSGGTLRVAYRKFGEPAAKVALAERRLDRPAPPAVVVRSPEEDEEIDAESVTVAAEFDGREAELKSMAADLDEGTAVAMTELKEGGWSAAVPLKGAPPGRHLVRVVASMEGGRTYARYVPVRVRRADGPEERWRARLTGAVRMLRAHGERLYAGAGDGTMHCLRLADGAPLWTFKTGGEILSRPLVVDGLAVFGSGDGSVYALDADGKLKWRYEAGAAVYSSPVACERTVFVGDNLGRLIAIDARDGTGTVLSKEPKYAVESSLHESGGVIYLGAWDQNVHAIGADGKVRWTCQGAGAAAEKAKRYFSPADCGPVVCGGRVWCADRAFKLSVIDASGKLESSQDGVAAVGLAEDGKSVYLRRTKDALVKLGPDGTTVWTATVDTDVVPAAPVEHKGVVYVCSDRGLLSAVDAAGGRLLWKYQAVPRLFVLGPPEARERLIFVGAQDGTVTCLRGPSP